MHHTPQNTKRFVVFENEIDLRAHEASVHGTSRRDGGTKIKLEFRIRRQQDQDGDSSNQALPTGQDFQYGLNGEAFVPEALPGESNENEGGVGGVPQPRQVNEPIITNEAHAARTAELRAMAARVREMNGLVPGGNGSAGLGGSGSGSSAGQELFPALGTATSAAPSSGNNSGLLVGWTSAGAAGTRLKKNPVGKVTEEEFPSLGGGSSRTATNRYAALGLGRPKTGKNGVAGPNFSAVASRSNNANGTAAAAASRNNVVGATSTPISTIPYASSMPIHRAPDMSAGNFPSLGGGTKMPPPKPYGPATTTAVASRVAPDLSGSNFPSLGGASASANRPGTSSANPYAAANALAKKLNAGKAPGSAPVSSTAFPSLSSSTDFPPPPAATAAKRPTLATALAAKKPPPPMDNILQFPPPSSSQAAKASAPLTSSKPNAKPTAQSQSKNHSQNQSLSTGMATVEDMKARLGTVRYKKLKSLTKDFANGSTLPEQYVDEAASIFDKGLSDESFWEFVPDLIRSIPNTRGVDEALNYLETLRVANEMQEREFGGAAAVGTAVRKNATSAKKVNYVLPAKKKNGAWGSNGNSNGAARKGKLADQNDDDILDSKPPAKPVAKKTSNNGESGTANGGTSRKSKAKKKNNELKNLAFGI